MRDLLCVSYWIPPLLVQLIGPIVKLQLHHVLHQRQCLGGRVRVIERDSFSASVVCGRPQARAQGQILSGPKIGSSHQRFHALLGAHADLLRQERSLGRPMLSTSLLNIPDWGEAMVVLHERLRCPSRLKPLSLAHALAVP